MAQLGAPAAVFFGFQVAQLPAFEMMHFLPTHCGPVTVVVCFCLQISLQLGSLSKYGCCLPSQNKPITQQKKATDASGFHPHRAGLALREPQHAGGSGGRHPLGRRVRRQGRPGQPGQVPGRRWAQKRSAKQMGCVV